MLLSSLFSLAAALPINAEARSISTRNILDDTYIVVFEKGLNTPNEIVHNVAKTIKDLGATINWEYHTVIRGFSVSGSSAAMDSLEKLNNDEYPFVIEKDKEVKLP